MKDTDLRAFYAMTKADFQFTLDCMGKDWMINNFGVSATEINSRAKFLGVDK